MEGMIVVKVLMSSSTMKGQVMANFIVEHNIESCQDAYEIERGVWKMFFDGSVCAQG
jgi:ribonuclease HI